MEISLTDAARLLGKSERQVRYLIKIGKIKATKSDGRWCMEREDLPLSPGQERAQKVKEERAYRIAQETLGPQPDPPDKSERRFSLRDLRATGEGLGIHRDLVGAAGGAHPAVAEFREAMMLLAGGFHEFHGREKAASYGAAREKASRAAMHLLMDGDAHAPLVDRIEHLWIPAVNGLIRRAERTPRR